jgi:GT2 family glycosyltransferase
MKNITAIIINFLREPYLFECIKSLKSKYPDMPVLVGENGKYSIKKKKEIESLGKDIKYINIGWDAGVCKARNKLIKNVKTDYVLIGDDDFKYYEKSDIKAMEDFLENNKDIDLIAGRIVEDGKLKNYQGYIHKYDDHFKYEKLDLDFLNFKKCKKSELLYKECDLTFNFFVARTEVIKKTKWDEEIKVAYEHSSFFIDFKKNGYKVAFTPNILVLHKPNLGFKKLENKEDYKVFRNRRSDKKRFFERFNISYVIGMNGHRNFYDSTNMEDITFCITMFERWDKLKTLLYSITKYYPTAKIIIADQGKKFIAKEYRTLYQELFDLGLKNKPTAINMPFDCGLSVCRNKLVGLARTNYVLILEEDFEFTENTKIKSMIDILENHLDISGIGGQVEENGIKLNFSHYYKKKGKTIKMVENKNEYNKNGYRDTEGILNFALFRRNIFDKVLWDKDIKVNGEHTDFLFKLKEADLKIVETIKSTIKHNKERDSEKYRAMRLRDEFLVTLFNKYKINKLIYTNGFTILLKDGIIVRGRGI